MTFEQLDKEQQLSIEAEQEFQANGSVVSEKYHEVMDLYDAIQAKHNRIVDANNQTRKELEEENFGDESNTGC